MIWKLESAGLGFYVQMTEVQQKLGLFLCESMMCTCDILPKIFHRQNTTSPSGLPSSGYSSKHETFGV